jgi:predicted RNA binding protein with dsRBD fold (UPF0201 family)
VQLIENFVRKGIYDQEKEEKVKKALKKAFAGVRLKIEDVTGIIDADGFNSKNDITRIEAQEEIEKYDERK